MQPIIIEKRNVYGRETMYVISDNANHVNALTGKKTIDRNDIDNLVALGLTVKLAASAEYTF